MGVVLEDISPRTPNGRQLPKANVWAFYQDCQSTCIQVHVSFVKLVDQILVLIT